MLRTAQTSICRTRYKNAYIAIRKLVSFDWRPAAAVISFSAQRSKGQSERLSFLVFRKTRLARAAPRLPFPGYVRFVAGGRRARASASAVRRVGRRRTADIVKRRRCLAQEIVRVQSARVGRWFCGGFAENGGSRGAARAAAFAPRRPATSLALRLLTLRRLRTRHYLSYIFFYP